MRKTPRLCDADIDFVIVGGFAGGAVRLHARRDYARVRETSAEIQLFGHRCRVISIEDLILAKESLARPKDLLVAEELRVVLQQKK